MPLWSKLAPNEKRITDECGEKLSAVKKGEALPFKFAEKE